MAIELFTYDDAIQHLTDQFEAVTSSNTRIGRNARRAVDNVYRDFPNLTRWTYYTRRTTLKTVASYSTGTVAYDHAGGSSERMVTLTTGTWPTWARFGTIRLNSVDYRIASRVSDSVITLLEEDNPGDDIAAGATYTLWRGTYPLPVDFRKLMSLVDVSQSKQMPIISVGEWQRRRSITHDSPGVPWSAAIFGDGEYYGGLQLALEPPPSSIRSYDMLYEAKPRDLNVVSFASGTVNTSGTGGTISTGTLPQNIAGSVVRFSSSATAPTNKYGSNPFYEQRVIQSRDGDTTFTMDQALTSNLTGVAYTISDPIDLENVMMQTGFLRMCEAEFAKIQNLEDYGERLVIAQKACRDAAGNDRRTLAAGPTTDIVRRWRDLPVTTD